MLVTAAKPVWYDVILILFKRKKPRQSEVAACGRQVGGGQRLFDVRNMFLKPVSFVMRFKRSHVWAEFFTSHTPLRSPSLTLMSATNPFKMPQSRRTRFIPSRQSHGEVNLPAGCKLLSVTQSPFLQDEVLPRRTPPADRVWNWGCSVFSTIWQHFLCNYRISGSFIYF